MHDLFAINVEYIKKKKISSHKFCNFVLIVRNEIHTDSTQVYTAKFREERHGEILDFDRPAVEFC